MKKRGQVATYLIIAIVILVVIASVVFLERQTIKESTEGLAVPEKAKAVETHLKSCIENAAEDGLIFIGMQGGHSDAITSSAEGFVVFPLVNSKEELLLEVNKAVKTYLGACDLTAIEEYSPELSGEIVVESLLTNDSVLIQAVYPLTISVEGTKFDFGTGSLGSEVPIRLDVVYEAAKYISGEYDPEYGVCLDCIISNAEENNLYFALGLNEDGSYTVSVTDKSSMVGELPYQFVYKLGGV